MASVLYSHVIMASISEAFPNFARLPYRLYIPSSFCQTTIKKWHANGMLNVALRGVKMMQVHAHLTALLENMKLSVALNTLLGTWKMKKI